MAENSTERQHSGPPTLVDEPVEAQTLPPVPMKADDEAPGFFDKPENVKRLQRGFLAVVALFIIADATGMIHYHEELGLEHIPGFYTLFSLVACVVLFGMAKTAAAFLKREEHYYD